MRSKSIIEKILLLIFLTILAVGIIFIVKQNNNLPLKQPTDFNFIFKYGVGAKNELNTFNQTFTKDMIIDPSITTKFNLTEKELSDVYRKIVDLGIFKKDWKFLEKNMSITPCSSYYLKIQINSEQRELSFDNCHGELSGKLQKFKDYIIKIIEAKEEYKKLPTPTGGYD